MQFIPHHLHCDSRYYWILYLKKVDKNKIKEENEDKNQNKDVNENKHENRNETKNKNKYGNEIKLKVEMTVTLIFQSWK